MNAIDKITGIIATGGLSSRMGIDKSRIDYHGAEQRYQVYLMLKSLCQDVYISCNSAQKNTIDKKYNFIIDSDRFSGNGPIAGLLTAFHHVNDSAILFIGCDYPLMDQNEIRNLISNRNKDAMATSFAGEDNQPEPLLTIYERKSFPVLLEEFNKGNFSLRKFLAQDEVFLIHPENPDTIKSIDTPEEYSNALTLIHNSPS